jgi:hypothetical protein
MSVMSLNTSVALLVLTTASASQVGVEAIFVPPPKGGAEAAIAVTLTPEADGIVINEKPAPQLGLDPLQTVLVDKQPPRAAGSGESDPSQAKYLDPLVPLRFPVAIAPGAARGTHMVRGTVTFYYCSKVEGWCKKGTSAIAVNVSVQ